MPSFQQIEIFWQHGKQYVSLNAKAGRTKKEIWEQVRLGCYGHTTWTGQVGGWKAANCADLVCHADREVNQYITDRDTILTGSLGILTVPPSYSDDVDLVANDAEDAVREHIFMDESQEWHGDGNVVV